MWEFPYLTFSSCPRIKSRSIKNPRTKIVVDVVVVATADYLVYFARREDWGICWELPMLDSDLEAEEGCSVAVAADVPNRMVPLQRMLMEVRWHDCVAALAAVVGTAATDIAAIATVAAVD
jgi:hypothetical protein